jgi:hypothetical protein
VLFGGTRFERDAIDGGVLDEPAVDDGAMLVWRTLGDGVVRKDRGIPLILAEQSTSMASFCTISEKMRFFRSVRPVDFAFLSVAWCWLGSSAPGNVRWAGGAPVRVFWGRWGMHRAFAVIGASWLVVGHYGWFGSGARFGEAIKRLLRASCSRALSGSGICDE